MEKPTGQKISRILLACVFIASIAITIFHLFGVLDIPWVNHRLPLFTLAIMGLLAGYLAFEIAPKLDDMTGQIISALGGTQVRCFQNISEVCAYVRERMEAAHTVDDLTWGPRVYRVSPAHREAYKDYRKTIEALGSRRDFRYREVMTFPDTDRLTMARTILEKDLPAYQLKYYDVAALGAPPLMRFVLIDDEVIFVYHRVAALPDEGVVWLAVRHPQIVEMARVYYAEAWKDACPVDLRTLARIQAVLTARSSAADVAANEAAE